MGETTMPNFVWKGFCRLGLLGFASDRFEREFAVDCLESPKLAVGYRFCHDVIAKENVDAPGWVHADFESFSKQDIAGNEIRVNSRYMEYLVKGNCGEVAILAFDHEMNAPGADSMEFALCRIDFDRFVKGLVVLHDLLVRRKVFRCARVKDPIFGVAVLTVPTDVGLSCHLHGRMESYCGF